MSNNITLRKAALVQLIDSALATEFRPNPDDDSPPGPGSPRWIRDLTWAQLNPQPYPPSGPNPQPWLTAILIRTVIDQAAALFRSAETQYSGEQSRTATAGSRSLISEVTEVVCGNEPPHIPFPWPWPYTSYSVIKTPLDLMVAGIQFHKAADGTASKPLKEAFSEAADIFIETGLAKLNPQPEVPSNR